MQARPCKSTTQRRHRCNTHTPSTCRAQGAQLVRRTTAKEAGGGAGGRNVQGKPQAGAHTRQEGHEMASRTATKAHTANFCFWYTNAAGGTAGGPGLGCQQTRRRRHCLGVEADVQRGAAGQPRGSYLYASACDRHRVRASTTAVSGPAPHTRRCRSLLLVVAPPSSSSSSALTPLLPAAPWGHHHHHHHLPPSQPPAAASWPKCTKPGGRGSSMAWRGRSGAQHGGR